MNKAIVILALVIMTLGISACNTVRGVGQDISGGANTVQGWMN